MSDYGPMSHLRARFVAQSLNEPDEQLCPVVRKKREGKRERG